VFGEVPAGQALLRSGAQVHDDIWVSGSLGDARIALDALLRQHALPPAVLAQARQRLEQPTPRVALGLALRGIATSCLDISDGLLGDLNHILEASRVGARIDANITRGLMRARRHPMMAALAMSRIDACTLAGGDDYELCFTAPPDAQSAVREAAAQAGVPVTCIGRIEAERGVRVMAPGGQQLPLRFAGFEHFA
jgi:thiamine-monophosphate kinase